MVDKIKKNKYQILELIVIFILTLLFNLTCNFLTYDEVWNYGFSNNILNGLIPYKDFNMIITPLYPYLGALFMFIFGKNLVTYYIFGSLICTMIFFYIKKQNPKSYYIVYLFLLFFSMPGYNLFCLLLLYVLMNLEENKSNDYLIGIFLALTFLTKQNIGIYLCIPTIFIKEIKRMIKRMIAFIIPISIFLIYLIYNGILYKFIDYAFLGINSFAKNNTSITPICLIIFFITMVYLIYKYVKTKDIKLIYIICFQLMAYPIFDIYHTIIPALAALSYFLKGLKLNKKMIVLAFTVFNLIVLSYNISLCKTEEYTYPNNTNIYKYKKISNQIAESINNVSDYLKQHNKERTFIIDMSAYLIKLEANIPIDKYDLLNDGNLGKDGQHKIINDFEKICQIERCTFLLNKTETYNEEFSQYNQDIYKYILDKYNEKGEINGLTIYKNY